MKLSLTGLLLWALCSAWGQAPLPQEQKTDEWILMTEPGAPPVLPDGVVLIRPLAPQTGAYLVRFRGEEEAAVRQQLGRTPSFMALQPNYVLSTRNVAPNDPYFNNQWNLERIQAHRAWEFTTGGHTALGDEIVVAVIDNGFDLDHPDLSANLWVNTAELMGQPGFDDDGNGYIDDAQGWNFDTGSNSLPILPHGTSVLGILAAEGDNDTGIAGINWQVRAMPLVTRTIGDIIEALAYVFEMRKRYNQSGGAEGAFVVAASASLGFNKVFCSEFPAMEDILDSLGSAGVLAVGATANGNWDVDIEGDIPTSCSSDYLIAVTNADRDDKKYIEAAFGDISIDLAAPGGEPTKGVFTTTPPGDYIENFGGTSAACPHVSGAVALLYAMPSVELAQLARDQPAETALLIKEAILKGVDQLPSLQGITQTGGRLNLYRSALYIHGIFQTIDLPDPIQYSDRRRLIRVFPNPLQPGEPIQIVYGSRDLAPVTVRLFNAVGQLLGQTTVSPAPFEPQELSLPTANLVAGLYWVVLDNGISPIAEKVVIY